MKESPRNARQVLSDDIDCEGPSTADVELLLDDSAMLLLGSNLVRSLGDGGADGTAAAGGLRRDVISGGDDQAHIQISHSTALCARIIGRRPIILREFPLST